MKPNLNPSFHTASPDTQVNQGSVRRLGRELRTENSSSKVLWWNRLRALYPSRGGWTNGDLSIRVAEEKGLECSVERTDHQSGKGSIGGVMLNIDPQLFQPKVIRLQTTHNIGLPGHHIVRTTQFSNSQVMTGNTTQVHVEANNNILAANDTVSTPFILRVELLVCS
ncbi:hypothetical protein TNCT_397781 [Trichonephila clavata]|uniref:Uncharacterized protein n=1 Tax=Trichonephila clavata TaxID=2740835 RepID=A0A8X6G4K4_TRICU|nr:hypothetical protein TNCT_397781 [Trichonephila clavata]